MKPYAHIAIRTKIETVGWDIGGQLLESLYLNGGLLVPEFVSHNADKITEPFEGKGQGARGKSKSYGRKRRLYEPMEVFRTSFLIFLGKGKIR